MHGLLRRPQNRQLPTVFISKTWFFRYPPSKLEGDRKLNEAPITQEEVVSHLLDHFDLHKPMGTDEIHLGVLGSSEVLTRPYSSIYLPSCSTGQVPVDWMLANMTPLHKKGQEEDPGS
ncbi:hypothetical protein DUI87_18959 [Hirundo rustica rustica]|uniref:Uncharacterized protein n=1 Tax=Hirundo rustica rustica TaxID=333673 RepID=A0A3M0JTZ2_HIRRU|nr:hypothetical protein DUI87_18959 [Hirundo rustica rustica]